MLTAIQIGADPALLWSRAAILETTGLRVVNAEGVPQAMEHLWGVPFEMVILCHSLPAAHRRQIVAAARRRNPSVPILLIDRTGAAVRDGIDWVLDPEPQSLLQSVRCILRLPEVDRATQLSQVCCDRAVSQA